MHKSPADDQGLARAKAMATLETLTGVARGATRRAVLGAEAVAARSPFLHERVSARNTRRLERLWEHEQHRVPTAPCGPPASGGEGYSQNDEDEILGALFAEIGTTNRFCVEIGASDGAENCTRNLIESGWTGVWVEADPSAAHRASQLELPVTVLKAAATPDNVQHLLSEVGVPIEPDLLVLDIDGNDYWVLRAILDRFQPRVLLAEYNSTYLPGQIWVQPPSNRLWDGTFRHGASLEALARLARRYGYNLVACDRNGVNACFLHRDVGAHDRLAPRPVAAHYTGPWFTAFPFGHVRSRQARRPMLALPPCDIRLVTLRAPRREGTTGSVVPGFPVSMSALVTNGSRRLLTSGWPAPISTSIRWIDSDGKLVGPEPGRASLPVPLAPGKAVRVTLWARAPGVPGHYRLAITLVQEWVAWWTDIHGDVGSVEIAVVVDPCTGAGKIEP